MATKREAAEAAARAAAQAARAEVAAPAIHGVSKGAKTVTVACKFPNGLLLHVDEKATVSQQTPTGPISITEYRNTGRNVFVRGPAEPNGQIPKGYKRPVVEGGYALTRGVSADFWEAWLDQHRDDDLVKNKIIFAHPEPDYLADMANEHAEFKSGFEPLDPDGGDPRIPKSTNAGVGNVGSADVGGDVG